MQVKRRAHPRSHPGGVAGTAGVVRIDRRPAQPRDQPQSGPQRLAAERGLVASYGGTGLAGLDNPAYTLGGGSNTVPRDFGGAFSNAWNGSASDYYIGASLNIPLRNRVAKADQYRSELEYRQAEVRLEELKKQIRIEVRNARYALEQSAARVAAAAKGPRPCAASVRDHEKEQQLGAASSFQTLGAQRDLALAQLDFVNAMTVYEKSRVELDRATGRTLEHNGIQVQDAINGTASSRK